MVGHISPDSVSSLLYNKRVKRLCLDQLLFRSNTIILVKHMLGWELKCQRKKLHINRDNIHENSKIVHHA